MADRIDSMRTLGVLLDALRKRSAAANPKGEEIREVIIEAVLPNGHFLVQGAEIPSTGTVPLRAGERVPVVFKQGVPTVIFAGAVRRAQFPTVLAGGGAIIEELFIATGPPPSGGPNVADVYFRNDQIIQALKVNTLIGGAPNEVHWGQTPEFFWTAKATLNGNEPDLAAVIYVIRLKRSPTTVMGATAPTAELFATFNLATNTLVWATYVVNFSRDAFSQSVPLTVANAYANRDSNAPIFLNSNKVKFETFISPLMVDERGHLIATLAAIVTLLTSGANFSAPFVGAPENPVFWSDAVIVDLADNVVLYSTKITNDFAVPDGTLDFDLIDWSMLPYSVTVVGGLCFQGSVGQVVFATSTNYFRRRSVTLLWMKAGVIGGLYGAVFTTQVGGSVFNAGAVLDGDGFVPDSPGVPCTPPDPEPSIQPLPAIGWSQARVITLPPLLEGFALAPYNVQGPVASSNRVNPPLEPAPSLLAAFQSTRRRIILRDFTGILYITTFLAQNLQSISGVTGFTQWRDVWNLKALFPDFLFAPDIARTPIVVEGKKPPFFLKAWTPLQAVTLDLSLPAFPVIDHALDSVKVLRTFGSVVHVPDIFGGDPNNTFDVIKSSFIVVNDMTILLAIGRFQPE